MTNVLSAVLSGGGAAAILDGIAATIDFRARGISFERLWQGVASGALGTKSFQGGIASVLAGLFFHILIAMTAALAFNTAATYIPALFAHYLIAGVFYGIVVYIFMNFAVIPSSALPPRPFSMSITIRQVIIHIVCVGLPISTAAHWLSGK